MSEQAIVIVLTVILGLLQLGDWYTTRIVLAKGGIEVNRLARKVMNVLTVDGYLALKAIITTVFGYYAGFAALPELVALVALYIFVVVHNIRQL